MPPVKVGDIIPCPIGQGEITDGTPAGMGSGYVLKGVGLARMRDIRPESELTEFCGPEDTEWAAEVLVTPIP